MDSGKAANTRAAGPLTTSAPAPQFSTGRSDRDAYVRGEIIGLLYRNAFALGANLLNALLVGIVLWDVMPQDQILIWGALMAMIMIVRYWTMRRYHQVRPAPAECDIWGHIYAMGSAATGCLWGATALVILTLEPSIYHIFVVFVVGGMGAGAVAASSAYPIALYAFLLPSMLPLAVAYLIRGEDASPAMGFMVLLFAGLLAVIATNFRRVLVRNFNLQTDNAVLIEDLSMARDFLEQRVQERTTELQESNLALKKENSERERAESAVRESAAQLRLITDNLPVLVTYLDSELRYIFLNKTAERWYDRPQAELIGRRIGEILSPENFAKIKPHLEAALAGTSQAFEVTIDYPDGKTRDIEVRHVLQRGPDGEPQGLLNLALDITDRRAIQEQLQQAQKMQTVGQLTGGVAHDFNNLLGVIIGNLELMTETLPEDDPNRPLVQSAMDAGLRGADVTHRLLAFSRKQSLAPEVKNLNDLISGLVTLLARLLGETIEIETDLDRELWSIEVDPHQMESALINLAVNAGHAMPSGGRLTLKASNAQLDLHQTARFEDMVPGRYACLEVSDTGEGMTAAVAEQAFEPFFTTKDVGQGSGLGLSMVYGFVKQSGGDVEIDSRVGQGTTVRMYFPVVLAADADDHPGGPVPAPPGGPRATILVVEDDPALRPLAVSMLENLGYDVLAAEDAGSALAAAAEAPAIDLLFTDVALPNGKSGVDLALELKKNLPRLKVLYTSGYADGVGSRVQSFPEGFDLVSKPYRKSELGLRVRTALEQGKDQQGG